MLSAPLWSCLAQKSEVETRLLPGLAEEPLASLAQLHDLLFFQGLAPSPILLPSSELLGRLRLGIGAALEAQRLHLRVQGLLGPIIQLICAIIKVFAQFMLLILI